MRTRIIDRNNDFTFGSQQASYAKGADGVALDIKLRLQEWYMDCFFDLTKGIDWRTRLSYTNQKKLLDRDVYEVARNTEGVVAINNFESYVLDRNYKATFEVIQAYSSETLTLEFLMRV